MNNKLASTGNELEPKPKLNDLTGDDRATIEAQIKTFQSMAQRLMDFAKRQADGGDYPEAAENFLLAEGINYCARELSGLLPDSN